MATVWGRVLVLMLGVALACGRGPGGDEDGGEPKDPDCHVDCIGRHTCEDGVVTTYEHNPVPCDRWEGECPHWESYMCERGCRADITSANDEVDEWTLCEENRPKQLGDPCSEPSHCEPQVAEIDDATGVVTNVYLECDVALGECIERPPPVVEDYLQHCGLALDPLPPESHAVTVADTCSGGLCNYVVDAAACVHQGCTIACDSDGDCPMGSICNDDYCKPGPPDEWDPDVIGLLGC